MTPREHESSLHYLDGIQVPVRADPRYMTVIFERRRVRRAAVYPRAAEPHRRLGDGSPLFLAGLIAPVWIPRLAEEVSAEVIPQAAHDGPDSERSGQVDVLQARWTSQAAIANGSYSR